MQVHKVKPASRQGSVILDRSLQLHTYLVGDEAVCLTRGKRTKLGVEAMQNHTRCMFEVHGVQMASSHGGIRGHPPIGMFRFRSKVRYSNARTFKQERCASTIGAIRI